MESASAPELVLETFAPLVGETFSVGNGQVAIAELLLVEASPGEDSAHAPRPTFSLLFQGPAEPLLPQAIYRFEHTQIGVADIFIVPLGRDEHGSVYEAVFA